jgi:hypothetical protein
MSRRSLLLAQQIQHIAGFGDVRKINLGLDFVGLGAARTRSLAGAGRFPGLVKMGPHLVRFMVFKRTGMGFLLGYTNFLKCIEYRLALDFQLSGQIVNSNLAHPPSIPPQSSR